MCFGFVQSWSHVNAHWHQIGQEHLCQVHWASLLSSLQRQIILKCSKFNLPYKCSNCDDVVSQLFNKWAFVLNNRNVVGSLALGNFLHLGGEIQVRERQYWTESVQDGALNIFSKKYWSKFKQIANCLPSRLSQEKAFFKR